MAPKGVDKLIFLTLKGLKFEDGAGKAKGLQAKRAQAAQEKETMGELGIVARGGRGGGKKG